MKRMDWDADYTVITVEGKLAARDWNDNGNPAALAIETDNGDEFLIRGNGKQKELFRHLRKKVKVSGVMRRIKGRKVITMNRYVLLEPSDAERARKSGKFNLIRRFTNRLTY